jgi:hypothetical protein
MRRYRGATREIVMARARKTKAKIADKTATQTAAKRKRTSARRKAVVQQSQNNWQIGAGIFALAALLGAGAYMISTNMETRTTVAQLVERFEVPQAVKDFPDTIRKQLPEMPAISGDEQDSGPIESAPVR